MASENGVETEGTQESDNDTENDSEEAESSSPETSDHQIPEERKYIKEGFLRCHDCGLITHKNAKTLETNFYSPSQEENEEEV